jgi:hypothetical protein
LNELTIEDIPTQPDGVTSFPDFIFATMARRGLGTVEVDASVTDSVRQSLIRWAFHHAGSNAVEVIAETHPALFRTYLARFACICGINLYGGEAAISIAAPFSGSSGTHHYAIILRNSQQAGFGIQIYLHAIDDSPNIESSQSSQSDALDDLIFANRKLEAVQLLRKQHGFNIAEATEVLSRRYRELRATDSARFACSDEEYWRGFHS